MPRALQILLLKIRRLVAEHELAAANQCAAECIAARDALAAEQVTWQRRRDALRMRLANVEFELATLGATP